MSHPPLIEVGCPNLVNPHTANNSDTFQLLWWLRVRGSGGQLIYPAEYLCFLSDGTTYVKARLDPRARCIKEPGFSNGVKVKISSLSKRVLEENQAIVLTIHELEVVSPSVCVIGDPAPLRKEDEFPTDYRPFYPWPDNPPGYIGAYPRFDYTTIARLSPSSEQFCIIVRITKISRRATSFNKSLRMKKLAVQMVVHDQTGDMVAIAWDESVDRSESLIVNGVYLIWGATVLDAITNTNGLTNSTLRLNCDGRTQFKRVIDDRRIPKQFFAFQSIHVIEKLQKGHVVDVLGVVGDPGADVVRSAKPSKDGGRRDGSKETLARVKPRGGIWLVDKSAAWIQLQAFDDFAKQFRGRHGKAVAIKGAMTDFSLGPCLSTRSGKTVVLFDDTYPECNELQTWYEAHTAEQRSQWRIITTKHKVSCSAPNSDVPVSKALTLHEAQEIGASNLDAFTVQAYISFNTSQCIIQRGCAVPECDAVVSHNNDGILCCNTHPDFADTTSLKYRLEFTAEDATGQHCVTAFDTVAARIIGESASSMHARLNSIHALRKATYYNILRYVQQRLYRISVKIRVDAGGRGADTWVADEMVAVELSERLQRSGKEGLNPIP